MCEHCNWEDLKEQIEKMLESGKFDWASETLEGIMETVDNKEHATDGQKTAVENIAASRPGWDD